ncbi:MAG: InlB B-repeat-containing protein [Balneolaceae bacterium]
MIVAIGCGGTKIELSFEEETYTVEVGKELPLEPAVKNEKDEEYKLVFSSEDTAVATYVDGKVKGIAVGEVKVKVTLEGHEKVFAEVTVEVVAAKKFTVTFNTDGGSAISAVEVTEGGKVTKPTNPTKAGHVFVNWYSNSAKTTVYNFDTPVTAALTLYAKWEVSEYDVTFDTDGGSEIEAVGVNHGEKVTQPDNPTKDGHNFVGWFSDEELTEEFDFDTEITANTTLYAKWELKTYNVLFNLGGGTGVANVTAKHGEKVAEPENNPTKDGYIFAGWYKEFNTVNEFDFETEVITSDTVIFAKWDIDMTGKVATEFELNGGSFSIFDLDSFINATPTKTHALKVYNQVSLYMEAYQTSVMLFDTGLDLAGTGWAQKTGLNFNDKGFLQVTEQIVGSGTPADLSKFDYVLVAHDGFPAGLAWIKGLVVGEIITFTDIDTATVEPGYVEGTINVYPAGTGDISGQVVLADDHELIAPVKDGYVFDGWFDNEDFTGDPVTVAVSGTVYAKWVPQTYNFTYELNGGTWSWTAEEVTSPKDGIEANSELPEIFMQDFFTWLRDNDLLESTVVDAGLHKTTWEDFSMSYTDPRAIYNWAADKTAGGAIGDVKGYSQLFLESGTGNAETGEILTLVGGFFGADGYKDKYATVAQHLAYLLYARNYGTANRTLWTGGANESAAGFLLDGYFYGTQGLRAGNDHFNALRGVIPTPTKGYKFVEGELEEYAYDFLKTQMVGGKEVVLSVPSRSGYLFVGWYDNPELTGTKITKVAEGTVPATKYYAKWEPTVDEFEVTFDSKGGSSVDSQIVLDGRLANEPVDPTKVGFTFLGWFTDEEATEAFDFSTAITADLDLVAKWELIDTDYNITLNTNGGNSMDPVVVHAGEAAVQPADPTREFFTFDKWYLDAELTQEYDFETLVYSDFTLYAKWTPVDFTISFEVNGGQYIYPNFADKDALKVALLTDFHAFLNSTESLDTFMHGEGNTTGFNGTWHSLHIAKLYEGPRPEAINESFFASSSDYMQKWLPFFDYMQSLVKTTNASQNFWNDLYVGQIRIGEYFKETRYQTTLNLPAVYTHPTKYNILSANVALPEVVKEGFIFYGWYDNAEFDGEAMEFIPTGTTGNLTLYARFVEEDDFVTVTFEADGGLVEGASYAINEEATPVLQDLQYFNDGYGTEASKNIWLYKGDNAKFAGDTELTDATWWAYKVGLNQLASGLLVVAENIGFSKDTPQGEYDYILLALWVSDTYSGFTFVQNLVVGEVLLVEGVDFTSAGSAVTAQIKKYAATDVDSNYNATLLAGEVLPTPVKEGFVFLGWYDNAEFTGSEVTLVPAEADTLYAKWEAILTVAEARDAAVNDLVTVKGIVTANIGNNVFIQDATGGVYIYLGNVEDYADILVIGNEVIISGKRAVFNQLVQLSTITDVVLVGTEKDLPETVEIEELVLADVLAQEGKLVTINGLTIKSIPNITTNSYTVVVTDGTVDLEVRVDQAIANFAVLKAFFEDAYVGQGINLVNIPVGRFNANPQVMPSLVSQMVLLPLTEEEIKDVLEDKLNPGTEFEIDIELPATVVVSGIEYTVTWVSTNPALSNAGVVTRPAVGQPDAEGQLTAEVKLGETVFTTVAYDVTVLAETGVDSTTVTASYPGGSTSNMTAENNATTVGLDPELFTVTSIERASNPLHVGLNTAGQIRLYGSGDTNGNVLTFAIAEGYTITKVEFEFGGTVGQALITAGETELHNGALTSNSTLTFSNLNDSEVSIKNINSGTGQIYILSVKITYIEG